MNPLPSKDGKPKDTKWKAGAGQTELMRRRSGMPTRLNAGPKAKENARGLGTKAGSSAVGLGMKAKMEENKRRRALPTVVESTIKDVLEECDKIQG